VGVEALLRWEHPERGLLVPKEFIDVAEEDRAHRPDRYVGGRAGLPAGAAVAGDAYRRRPAVRQREPLRRQLDTSVLIDNVADIIERTGLDAGRLGLEITESVIMRDPKRRRRRCAR